MTPLTVVYDACVLYPAPLRDLLMRLAMTGVFRARWTHEIHEEWMRNVLANRPDLSRKQLERTRDLMNRHALGSVVTGYESLVGGLSLPDPDDRHVLAAAIRSGASIIVTFNLKDFPQSQLSKWQIEAHHPDEFIQSLLRLSPAAVLDAVRQQRASLKHPPMSIHEFLDSLERQQIPLTVSHLRAVANKL